MRKVNLMADLTPGSPMAAQTTAHAAGVPEVSLLPIDCGWDVRLQRAYTDLRHLGHGLDVIMVKCLDRSGEAIELTGQLSRVCRRLSREGYLIAGYTDYLE